MEFLPVSLRITWVSPKAGVPSLQEQHTAQGSSHGKYKGSRPRVTTPITISISLYLSLLFLSLLPPRIIFSVLHSLMHHILLHLHSLFSRNKNILLHNHRTFVKFRITLIITLVSIFVIVPIMSFYNSFLSGPTSHPKLCSTFSYHAS